MAPYLATTDQNFDLSFSHSFSNFVFHLAMTTKWPFCWGVQLTLPILPSVDYSRVNCDFFFINEMILRLD